MGGCAGGVKRFFKINSMQKEEEDEGGGEDSFLVLYTIEIDAHEE